MRHRMPTKKFFPLLLLAGMITLIICTKDGERWVASSSYQPISIDAELLRPGDLIFRKGSSMVSNIVRLVDGGVVYTHVGIIAVIDGNLVVVHSVPAENRDQKDMVRIEALDDFIRPERASAIAVYRPKRELGDSVPQFASDYALNKALQNTPFDAGFCLSDTNRLYCTELIWRAYLASGIDICDEQFDMLSISLGKGPYILPSRLVHSPYFEQATFLFTKNHTK